MAFRDLPKTLVVGLLLVFVGLFSWNVATNTGDSVFSDPSKVFDSVKGIPTPFKLDTSQISVSITVENEYPAVTDKYDWDLIVEPYRITHLNASVSSSLIIDYTWSLEGVQLTGNPVDYMFTDTGLIEGQLKLEFYSDEGELVDTKLHTFELMRRYVRRELRALSEEDRELFFETIHTAYTISAENGIELFGEDYKGIEYFMIEHLSAAARKTCDHWHDGAAIVVHHMSYTLEFEQNLQLINKKVTIPYWEYTYDEYIYDDWESSPVFEADWFGNASPNNTDHILTEGRWAYLPILRNEDETMFELVNPYSLLRSPWNTNPVPYVTRHDKVLGASPYTTYPSCSTFATAFSSPTLAEMNVYINGITHGPVHIMIGGHWNIDNDYYTALFGDDIYSILLISKNLWRQGYSRCPDSCSDGDTCTCSCPLYDSGDLAAYDILSDSNQLKYLSVMSDIIYYDSSTDMYKVENFTVNETHALWNSIVESLCEVGHAGEMYSSAAPSDPLFWVLHTTSERFLQYKRILSYEGTDSFDETWGYDHQLDYESPSDDQLVCDWSSVDSLSDLPSCIHETCVGHFPTDGLPQENLIKGTDTYTNLEFYEIMSPKSEKLPYVYDSFTWEHCEEQGIYFT